MNREETKKLITEYERRIKVMQHFVNGGEVEYTNKAVCDYGGYNNPGWRWDEYDYRIKRQLPEVGKWYEIPGIGKMKCIAYDTDFGIYYFTKGWGVHTYTNSYDFTNFKQVEP